MLCYLIVWYIKVLFCVALKRGFPDKIFNNQQNHIEDESWEYLIVNN